VRKHPRLRPWKGYRKGRGRGKGANSEIQKSIGASKTVPNVYFCTLVRE